MKTAIVFFALSGLTFGAGAIIDLLPTATIGGRCATVCYCEYGHPTAGSRGDLTCNTDQGKSTRCSSWCQQ